MGIVLKPCALVPWVLLDSNSSLQDMDTLEAECQGLYPDEGFDWCEVKLSGRKQETYERLMAIRDIEYYVAQLLAAATLEAMHSQCDRAHIGVALATPRLELLTLGHNERPPYMMGPCDLFGCEPEKRCRITYSAEAIAFGKLREHQRPAPGLIVVSNVVPTVDGMNICEHNGVGIIMFENYRSLAVKDVSVGSYKTIRSHMLFLKISDVQETRR